MHFSPSTFVLSAGPTGAGADDAIARSFRFLLPAGCGNGIGIDQPASPGFRTVDADAHGAAVAVEKRGVPVLRFDDGDGPMSTTILWLLVLLLLRVLGLGVPLPLLLQLPLLPVLPTCARLLMPSSGGIVRGVSTETAHDF